MTRVVANVVLILAAILFASSASLWEVPLGVPKGSTRQIVQYSGAVHAPPSSPVPLSWGREVFRSECISCHHSAVDNPRFGQFSRMSPADIYELITWGKTLTGMSESSSHPTVAEKYSDLERWAAAVYACSSALEEESPATDSDWRESWLSRLENSSLPESTSSLFVTNCAACHGPAGYGNGPLASDLLPGPRNLRDTVWLFRQSSEHLVTVIEEGGSVSDEAGGSGMPSFKDLLSFQQMTSLVFYIMSWGYSLDDFGPPPSLLAGMTNEDFKEDSR